MANRYKAFLNTLLHEDSNLLGVCVVDSNGYQERWGINQKSWPQLKVENLSFEDAIHRCYSEIWPRGLDEIQSQTVANAVFDVEFNNGRTNGVRMLQRALGVHDDGILGPQTIAAANADPNIKAKLQSTIEDHYRAIAAANPAEAKYLENWLARVKENFTGGAN